jgi:uncharacterized protein (DUF2225 family)
MTTLQQIELTCPVCETQFRSQAVVSTNSFGGKRTDFHERAAGTQPLPYLVHMCNRCGYTGSERDFTEDADVTPMVREQVWTELAPQIGRDDRPGAAVSGSEKYEFAAKVAEWQGLEPRHVADLLLRAAWCCVDEGDLEAERYFRRKAAWAFERALDQFDGVAREERAYSPTSWASCGGASATARGRASGSTSCRRSSSTTPRSSGCSTRRGSSGTARASGSAEC